MSFVHSVYGSWHSVWLGEQWRRDKLTVPVAGGQPFSFRFRNLGNISFKESYLRAQVMGNADPNDNEGKEEENSAILEVVEICKNGTPDQFKLDEHGCVVGVTGFEDLLEMMNPFGRWNIITLLASCLGVIVLPFQAITYQFLGDTPEYWCQVDALNEANWTQQQIIDLAIPFNSTDADEKGCKFYNYDYTKAVEMGYESAVKNRDVISVGDGSSIYCSSRYFNVSHYSSTLVAEWDLVCERRALYSTTQSASQLGVLIGVLSFGYFMDLYGRRPIILLNVGLSFLAGLAAAASPVLPLYIIFKILVSCFNYGYFTGCFIFMMEICSPSQRSSIGSVGGIPWSVGYMIVPGIAYLIRPWRWLQVAYTFPTIFFFSFYWLIPESPRWLISQGRFDEAAEILTKAAKVNGRCFPPAHAVVQSMKRMIGQKEEKPKENLSQRIVSSLRHFLILVLKPELRKNILISYFCWFAVSMVYYGISLNSGNLSTDPYMYVFLGGLAEIPSYFVTWAMVAHLGRRLSLTSYYVVCGITICIIAILLATQDEVSFSLLIVLSLVGKIAIISAFHVVYIYTAELFPTEYRSLAVGESSMMARVGSITSPYINDILGAAITWGPSALFAVMSAAAASLSLLLPETRDCITESTGTTKGNTEEGDVKLEMKNAKVNEAFNGD
ncbi:organic cation transporter protein-like isoform X1 [Macrobrachium rosenbergii]|uniref:organic cation transporter protein-like isoform X1 n=2 Tax=Macrobrachium rosenbergii TaxID=79674 RepID=UPI0034D76149